MIISLTLGIIIAVVVGLAIAALIYFLLKKAKVGQKAGIGIGAVVGILAGTAIVMMAGRITVVKSAEDFGTYLVYGSPEYEFSNGFKMNLDMGASKGYVINDSEMELVLEKVIYTTSYALDTEYDILILPMSITEMPGFKVNYYFGDIPPDEIEISQGSSSVTKYWLRTKSSYEADYGEMYYDTDIQSVQVGSGNTANDSEEMEEETEE